MQQNQKQHPNQFYQSQCPLKPAVFRPEWVYSDLSYLFKPKKGRTVQKITNNLSIPNSIRTTDHEIEIHLFEINEIESKSIRELCVKMANGQIDLHVLSAPICLLSNKDIVIPSIKEQSSWTISIEDFKYAIRAVDQSATIAVEYRKTPPPDYNPKVPPATIPLPNAEYIPTDADFRLRRSFLCKSLNKDEISKNIIFMDAEFTGQMADKSRAPVSITMIDGNGDTILDTLITPRHRIVKDGSEFHGIKEKQLRNQADEYKILKEIRELCRGKILIGHDLQMELNHLYIDRRSLLGIRDLAGTKTLQKMKIFPKGQGQLYKLQIIAEEVLGRKIQSGYHTALEDTLTIKDIYQKIESIYEDHNTFSKPSTSMEHSLEPSQPPSKKLCRRDHPSTHQPIWRDISENIFDAWQNLPPEIIDLDSSKPDKDIVDKSLVQSTLENLFQSEINIDIDEAIIETSTVEDIFESAETHWCDKMDNSTDTAGLLTSNEKGTSTEYSEELILIHNPTTVNNDLFFLQTTDVLYKSEGNKSMIWKLDFHPEKCNQKGQEVIEIHDTLLVNGEPFHRQTEDFEFKSKTFQRMILKF